MSASSSRDRTRGYAIALASAVVFSGTAIFIRLLTDRFALPVGVLCFWRSVLVVASLAPVLAVVRPSLLLVRRCDLGFLTGVGLLLAVFNLLWVGSVARCGAALATVLVYTSGAFTALLAWGLLRERLSGWGTAALAVCFGGCVLVSGAFQGASSPADAGGVIMGGMSGALYGMFTVLCRIGARRGINAWTMVLYVFSANAAAQLLVLALGPSSFSGAPGLADLLWLGRDPIGWMLLLALAAGPTVLGFGLFNMSLVHLASSEANLILTLEPALTAALAFVVLGERMSTAEWFGSLVILAGLVLLNFGGRRRDTTQAVAAEGS